MVNLDPKNILSALRRHLQEGERITSVVPMSIGHSNETYRLEGLDLVLRMPPSQAALVEPGHGMRGQFELYAVLRGLPGAPLVPAVRYLCEDEAVLGAPFYLMEAVNGEPFTECEVAP